MMGVSLHLRLKVPIWHQVVLLTTRASLSFAGICSFQLHIEGTKIIRRIAELEAGWPRSLPCEALPGSDAAGGTRGTRELSQSPETPWGWAQCLRSSVLTP